ncbi:MAG TPA: hypothetical protein K8W06_04625 [Limosilactobacillus coleohominis]|nr:hypothetical protein [Limosilactobacillus coleohominis]
MNYLSISINFARQIPMLNPTTGEIALFHALLDLKNIDMNFKSKTGKKKSWADGIDPTSATLQLYSGLSANGIVKAREKLKALGLIDFKSRGRRKSTIYRFLDLSGNKSAVISSDNSSDKSSDISGDNSSDNSVPLNKTKQNNISSSESPTPNEKKAEPEQKAKREYDHQSEPYRLAKELKTGIMANNPDHRKITESQLQSWADDMRKMLELDKRSYSQVSNMISWCQRDDFWKTNILSASKLRKQYDQMRVRAMNEWQQQKHKPLLTNEERDGHFG